MVQHQRGGLVGVAGLGRFQEGGMLVRRAHRVALRLVQHGDQRAASDQLLHDLLEHLVAHHVGQQHVEIAQQLLAHLVGHVRQRAALFLQMLFQHAVVGRLGADHELARQRHLDHAARREDLARLGLAGLADEGALVRHDVNQLVLGQDQQRGADLGAADRVQPRQRFLAQLGPGRQLAGGDGLGDVVGDVGGTVAVAGFGGAVGQRDDVGHEAGLDLKSVVFMCHAPGGGASSSYMGVSGLTTARRHSARPA